MADLGERLARLRRMEGMTQEELAGKLGVHRATLASWEIGRMKPRTDTLRRIASLFGISLSYLLDSEQEQTELSAPDSFPAEFLDWLDRMGYELRIVKKSNDNKGDQNNE